MMMEGRLRLVAPRELRAVLDDLRRWEVVVVVDEKRGYKLDKRKKCDVRVMEMGCDEDVWRRRWRTGGGGREVPSEERANQPFR
jgi:hypothetical protein